MIIIISLIILVAIVALVTENHIPTCVSLHNVDADEFVKGAYANHNKLTRTASSCSYILGYRLVKYVKDMKQDTHKGKTYLVFYNTETHAEILALGFKGYIPKLLETYSGDSIYNSNIKMFYKESVKDVPLIFIQ